MKPFPANQVAVLFLFLVSATGPALEAQELPHPAPSQQAPGNAMDYTNNPAVQDITNQEIPPPGNAKDAKDATDSNPAVTNITGKDNFFQDIFSSGSPFYFALTFGETYSDNIFISQQKSEDLITHVSPLVDFVKGDKTAADANYFNVSFSPTFFFYAYNSAQNRTDYNADAIYQHTWTRLTLSLEQSYQELTDPSIDIGNFFKRDLYTTTLNGSYVVDDHLSFAGSETQRISTFQNQGISSTGEWITDAYASYQVGSKLSVGVGPRIGFVDITGAPNQTYQDLLFRLTYNVSQKININFDGGGEYRQFQSSPSRVYPIFDLNATYTPFDGTQLSASGYRQEVLSYQQVGSEYTSTLIQANVKQRFLRNFFLLGTIGYNLADYQPVAGQQTSGANRDDNYYFLTAGLEWDPHQWLSVAARYQYSEDDSSFSQNSFNNNQLDLQTSLQF